MRHSVAFLAFFCVSAIGCGGSGEATKIDSNELQNYVDENAAVLASEEEALEAEEAAEDDEDDE